MRVFEKDVETALGILKEEDLVSAEEDESEIVCPRCNSLDISYEEKREAKSKISSVLISIVFMIYPFRVLRTFRCNQCGYEFK